MCNCRCCAVGVASADKKCDIAIFCHCDTQSVISVNKTDETESCIIVKYIELCMISSSTKLYLNHT